MNSAMSVPKSSGFTRQLLGMIPNAVVLGSLLGMLYWGHSTHWSFGGHDPASEPSAPPGAAAAGGQQTLAVSAAVSAAPSVEGRDGERSRVEFRSPADVEKAGLVVGEVIQRPMDEHVVANGVVTYDQTRLAQLSVRVPGTVWRVEKQIGQFVSKGEVLVLLDALEVGRAKAELLQSMVNYDLKLKNLARMKTFTDSVPERAVREAEAQVREGRVRRFNAQQTLVNLGLPIDFSEIEKLSDDELTEKIRYLGIPPAITCTLDTKTTTANLIPLVAPFDGVVIGRELVVGEVVDPSHTQFTLADVSRMWINLNVDREDASRLAIGQDVQFQADGVAREIVSRISWISTAVDQKTRTVQVRAEVENPIFEGGPEPNEGQRLLRANMFGTGKICVSPHPRAVAVPGAALHTKGERRIVFVPMPDGRTFEPRDVKTGVSTGGFTEILSGLAAGDPVVTTGSYMLKSELFGAVD